MHRWIEMSNSVSCKNKRYERPTKICVKQKVYFDFYKQLKCQSVHIHHENPLKLIQKIQLGKNKNKTKTL